jgi:phage replication O-like protein O
MLFWAFLCAEVGDVASPQLENGYTMVANEILEALAKARLTGAQFQIVIFVFRKTYGWIDDYGNKKKTDWISFSQIAEHTGLYLRTVKREVASLVNAKVLTKISNGPGYVCQIGFQKDYDLWKVEGFAGSAKADTSSVKPDTSGAKPDTTDSVKPDTHKRNYLKKKDTMCAEAPEADSPQGWWRKIIESLQVEPSRGKTSYGLVGSLVKQYGSAKVEEQTWDIYQSVLDGKIQTLQHAQAALKARFKERKLNVQEPAKSIGPLPSELTDWAAIRSEWLATQEGRATNGT